MAKGVLVVLSLCALVLIGIVEAQEPLSQKLRGSRPNIIILFVDDTGWGDYSFNDPSVLDTPRLLALSKRGMTLSDFHAAASVCTPSRAGLLTGRLGLRTGVTRNFGPFSKHGLPLNESTIAEVLQSAGYRTAMAGKWHLGHRPPYGPIHRGFEEFLGLPMSHDYGCTDNPGYNMDCPERVYDVCAPADLSRADGSTCHIGPKNPWNESVPLYHNDKIIEQPVDLNTLAQRYAQFASKFIRTVTSETPNQPFFIYMAWNHMHVPVGNHDPKFANTSVRGVYGDTLRQLDDSIGAVIDTLDSTQTTDNTLILMTGDNGAPDDQCNYGGSNKPFVGKWLADQGKGGSTGKTTTWEGGHREPGLAVWPGKIPSGSHSAALSSTLDYLPTIAALAGTSLPTSREFDGVDLSPVLFDGKYQVRSTLFHPNSGCEGKLGELETVRVNSTLKAKYRTGGTCKDCQRRTGEVKYHDPPLLFDLAVDQGEAHPIDKQDPRHTVTVNMVRGEFARIARSISQDHVSIADYSGDFSERPCCNKEDHLCRCKSSLFTV